MILQLKGSVNYSSMLAVYFYLFAATRPHVYTSKLAYGEGFPLATAGYGTESVEKNLKNRPGIIEH